MCSFIGFCNMEHDLSSQKNIETIKSLTCTLTHNNQCEENIYFSKNICLGYKNLNIINSANTNQPFIFKYKDNTYTIVYIGQIYTIKDIRNKLIKLDYEFTRIF